MLRAEWRPRGRERRRPLSRPPGTVAHTVAQPVLRSLRRDLRRRRLLPRQPRHPASPSPSSPTSTLQSGTSRVGRQPTPNKVGPASRQPDTMTIQQLPGAAPRCRVSGRVHRPPPPAVDAMRGARLALTPLPAIGAFGDLRATGDLDASIGKHLPEREAVRRGPCPPNAGHSRSVRSGSRVHPRPRGTGHSSWLRYPLLASGRRGPHLRVPPAVSTVRWKWHRAGCPGHDAP